MRNCFNRHQLQPDIAWGNAEWLQVPGDLKHVMKIDDVKFYRCPIAVITPYSWQLLQLVNDTTNGDCDLLPVPPGHPALAEIAERPEAYREAVRIVKSERMAWRNKQIKESSRGR